MSANDTCTATTVICLQMTLTPTAAAVQEAEVVLASACDIVTCAHLRWQRSLQQRQGVHHPEDQPRAAGVEADEPGRERRQALGDVRRVCIALQSQVFSPLAGWKRCQLPVKLEDPAAPARPAHLRLLQTPPAAC